MSPFDCGNVGLCVILNLTPFFALGINVAVHYTVFFSPSRKSWNGLCGPY